MPRSPLDLGEPRKGADRTDETSLNSQLKVVPINSSSLPRYDRARKRLLNILFVANQMKDARDSTADPAECNETWLEFEAESPPSI